MYIETLVIVSVVLFFLGYGGWIFFSSKRSLYAYPEQPRSLTWKMETICLSLMVISAVTNLGIAIVLTIDGLKNL